MLQSLKKDTHARLMGRMAKTTGAELGGLSDADWSEALTRCCNCANPGACEDWLEAHSDGAERAPGFCANPDLMQRPSA